MQQRPQVNGASAPESYSALIGLMNTGTRLVIRVARGLNIDSMARKQVSKMARLQVPQTRQSQTPLNRFRRAANLIRLGAVMHFGDKTVVERGGKVKASAVVLGKKRFKHDVGFRFVTEAGGRHRITEVEKGSSAGKTHMRVGDYLARVNGVATKGLSHLEVAARLRKYKKKVIHTASPMLGDAICPSYAGGLLHVCRLDTNATPLGCWPLHRGTEADPTTSAVRGERSLLRALPTAVQT